ncbi:acyl-CoA N-acyltransferase [Xylariomycetidae sp. FL0641]|nr:acyl-CoA N-acyltransferase [Xylariomycetidae sp. FL0641]
MAPQKRKRPHDAAVDTVEQPTLTTRRATRQHPANAPAAPAPEHTLRSGRARAGTNEEARPKVLEALHTSVPNPDAPEAEAPKPKPLRQTRITKYTTGAAVPSADSNSERVKGGGGEKENFKPATDKKKNRDRAPEEVKGREDSPPRAGRHTTALPTRQSGHTTQIATRTSRATAKSPAIAAPKHSTPIANRTARPTLPPLTPGGGTDRNIDKVVFGDICFDAWYPSYYGKEVLGPGSGAASGPGEASSGSKHPLLDRLYVCPCCFKYSKEIVPWWDHVLCCEREPKIPGRRVYTHPKPGREVRGYKKDENAAGSGRADVETQEEQGEWSVWEVDGEKEVLFSQNLCLFAKLFLDNKSVFFDVMGFNYFLLVYTPPPSTVTQPSPSLYSAGPPTTSKTHTTADSSTSTSTSIHPLPPRPQIVGFFSKEKMSWDSNNLACILVFPPWQRRGLGALLMGVSYEISRREQVLGGPEKPISELGRRGYRRYWAGEIARWVLGISAEDEKRHREGETNKGDRREEEEGIMVDVNRCSQATWIVPEDCLTALRDMGVTEAETGLPSPSPEVDGDVDEKESNMEEGDSSSRSGVQQQQQQQQQQRIRIDKAAVRKWVADNGIDLSRACDPDGFVEGYAVKTEESEEEE